MEYAIIVFGLLAIGCTCMLFVTIGTYNRKISEIHKAIANLHVKSLTLESDLNIEKKKTKTKRNQMNSTQDIRKEVVYKVPKKISGDLTMTNYDGKSASVQATLKVKSTE